MLLEEARLSQFTQLENSVKYGQFLAARRAFFYDLVTSKYPDLFNASEKEEIANWFSAINQRALTVGWVDWMYAIAFNQWPEGPYLNQECGAGLLAVLETTGLADQSLSEENKSFLAEIPRGWSARFRNSDDTYGYQVAWMQHAWFQSQWSGELDPLKQRQAFEWFLLQALPDGSPLGYNHIGAFSHAPIAYWVNAVLNQEYQNSRLFGDLDEQALWIAGRSLDYLEEHNGFINAQPGMEIRSTSVSKSPSWGSCLIFGEFGLPTQLGPLISDKIVFRDGWDLDSHYLLLNLRFTGWHRYKATNSIILAYQSGPLISEANTREEIAWLPEGRSLPRDKRTPRESLNGMLVERSGFSKVVWELTSHGSIWAQDPPFYATVKRFETGDEVDTSTTVLEEWRGWTQERTIFFQHHGPLVIQDKVEGHGKQSAIVWNFPGEISQVEPARFTIRQQEPAAELLMVRTDKPLSVDSLKQEGDVLSGGSRLLFVPGKREGFNLLTILLSSDWVGAHASVIETSNGKILTITKGAMQTEFLLSTED